MVRFNLFYNVLVGILLAATVGFGIENFYPSLQPSYPPQGFEATNQNELVLYDRNVFLIIETISIVLVFVSIFLFKKTSLLKEGILLGGIFTTAYALIRATTFGNQDARFIFVGLFIALLFILFLGHYKLSD